MNPRLLLALGGVNEPLKRSATAWLAEMLLAAGHSVTLLDNSHDPLERHDVPTIRLSGGCICCSLANQLFPALARAQGEVLLLPLSPLAQPDGVRHLLNGVGSSYRVRLLALASPPTDGHSPYLTGVWRAHADLTWTGVPLLQGKQAVAALLDNQLKGQAVSLYDDNRETYVARCEPGYPRYVDAYTGTPPASREHRIGCDYVGGPL
jgi:hypothetical protein